MEIAKSIERNYFETKVPCDVVIDKKVEGEYHETNPVIHRFAFLYC